MTVLRPSLPPVISSTTRMLSLPGAAAWAVRATNCGTIAFKATSDEALQRVGQELPAVKHVRYSVMDDEGHLRQLRFRHRQDGVDGLAHPTIEGGAGGLAPGHEGHELRPYVGADAAGKIQIQE